MCLLGYFGDWGSVNSKCGGGYEKNIRTYEFKKRWPFKYWWSFFSKKNIGEVEINHYALKIKKKRKKLIIEG